jgi:hypothetical protein
MKSEDQHGDGADFDADAEAERIFNDRYLADLKGSPSVVCLESEDFVNQLARTMLINVLQECTSLANVVLILFTRLLMHSPAALSTSCSWLYKRTIWS